MAYVQADFNCITQEIVNPDKPIPFPDLNLPTPDPDSNDDLPDEDGPYDERERNPPDSYRDWWYHTDHLGSSTYLTDNFGRPSHYYETLPFGEMIVEHNQSSYYDNAYKFNGKELDEATGMYYYGARYYDPRISIFVSVDQKVEQTMTPYQYVHNNPIMFIDPTGMSAENGDGGGWFSRAWSEVKSWFGRSPKYQNIPTDKPKTTVIVVPIEDNGSELETGTSWYENGVTSTVVNSTTVVNQPNVGTPYYSFIYPQDLGSWGEAGSDGKIWIGCMSCHGERGAYRYAAYNSREALAGYMASSVLNLTIGGSGSSSIARSSTQVGEQVAVHGNSLKSMRPTW